MSLVEVHEMRIVRRKWKLTLQNGSSVKSLLNELHRLPDDAKIVDFEEADDEFDCVPIVIFQQESPDAR